MFGNYTVLVLQMVFLKLGLRGEFCMNFETNFTHFSYIKK